MSANYSVARVYRERDLTRALIAQKDGNTVEVFVLSGEPTSAPEGERIVTPANEAEQRALAIPSAERGTVTVSRRRVCSYDEARSAVLTSPNITTAQYGTKGGDHRVDVNGVMVCDGDIVKIVDTRRLFAKIMHGKIGRVVLRSGRHTIFVVTKVKGGPTFDFGHATEVEVLRSAIDKDVHEPEQREAKTVQDRPVLLPPKAANIVPVRNTVRTRRGGEDIVIVLDSDALSV